MTTMGALKLLLWVLGAGVLLLTCLVASVAVSADDGGWGREPK